MPRPRQQRSVINGTIEYKDIENDKKPGKNYKNWIIISRKKIEQRERTLFIIRMREIVKAINMVCIRSSNLIYFYMLISHI